MSNTERKYGMHWMWAFVIFRMVNTFATEFTETWSYSYMESVSTFDEWMRMLTIFIWVECGLYIACKAFWCLLTRKRYGGSSGWRWYTLGMLGIIHPISNTIVNIMSIKEELTALGTSDVLSMTMNLLNTHIIASGIVSLVLSIVIYRAAIKSYIRHILLVAVCSEESDC